MSQDLRTPYEIWQLYIFRYSPIDQSGKIRKYTFCICSTKCTICLCSSTMPVSLGWSAHRLHSNLGSWVCFARQFGLLARRLLGHALATKSQPLTALFKNLPPLMKICPCTAQKLPGCTHVLPTNKAAIKHRRNHWTSKLNCDIMEVIYLPLRITVHLTVQGISRYACCDYRDAGITVQLTVRSARITYGMKTLLLEQSFSGDYDIINE